MAGSNSYARIDKKGNIEIRTDDWREDSMSNLTTKKGKWALTASITPTGNIDEK